MTLPRISLRMKLVSTALTAVMVLSLSGCATAIEGTPQAASTTGSAPADSDALPDSDTGSDDQDTPSDADQTADSAELPTVTDPAAPPETPSQATIVPDSATNPPPDEPGAPAVDVGSTVASVTDSGVVRISLPDADSNAESAPAVIEIYEDALCPFCSRFEVDFGAEIAAALESGQLIVDYRMVNFLDEMSDSGDYSSRAMAALLAIADVSGDVPGVALAFHQTIFDPAVQPGEGAATDLSNAQLADIAAGLGASQEALNAIIAGDYVSDAADGAAANLDDLRDIAARIGRSAGTPSVAFDGDLVPTSQGWLGRILG